MVSAKSVEDQLKKIGFNTRAWNRSECLELASIILPEEEIFECVNGWYEGGFALLCATDIRILLVDKKPLKFLTVEDLRFDTINQIDYGHRLLDAHITVSAGMKVLKFRSNNKPRLRKLIGHVQHRMAEIKLEQSSHTESQKVHLQQIDQQLQTYLLAQYQQHESMRRQIAENGGLLTTPQSSLGFASNQQIMATASSGLVLDQPYDSPSSDQSLMTSNVNGQTQASYISVDGVSTEELYRDGVKEIFGKQQSDAVQPAIPVGTTMSTSYPGTSTDHTALEINPLKIAYSKLPMVLRNRRIIRTSLYTP